MIAYNRVIDAALRNGRAIKESCQGKAMVQCPAHDDRRPSLSVRQIDGHVLMYCHAGCDTAQVVDNLGLTMSDLFDDPAGRTYEYPDRRVHRTPDKQFKQSGTRPKTGGALYHCDRIGDATTVYVVEGEKDVDTVESAGAVAVCSAMGAGKAHLADWTPLRGLDVIVVADKDKAGRDHAVQIAELLDGIAASVRIVEAKVGKDAADHIVAGLSLDELVPVDDADVPARRARITWADQIEPEPVVWAWKEGDDGRIPSGSLSVAAGREGTGKSSFGIWFTAHLTRGTLPGSFYGTPRTVFYVAVEDSWKYTIVPRLLAAGADLSRVARFEVVSTDDEELTLSLPHDNTLLEMEVRQHNVAGVVIDPLMSVIGERIDTHREREVRSALDPLSKIADRTGSVFLGIAHFNKGSGTDAASLITGSGAFKNVPRSVFGFARDESDDNGGRVMSQVKNSLGRDDLPSLSYVIESVEIPTAKGVAETGKFVFTGESDRSVADILRDSRSDPEEHDERKEAASWLVDYLIDNSGEMPAKDVFKAALAEGYSKDAVKRAKGKRVRSVKSGDGWVWQLIVEITPKPTSKGAAREQGSGEQKPAPLLPSLLPCPPIDPPAPTCDDPPDDDGLWTNQPNIGRQQTTPELSTPDGYGDPCAVCGQQMSAPVSIERGICERCWLAAKRDQPPQEASTTA